MANDNTLSPIQSHIYRTAIALQMPNNIAVAHSIRSQLLKQGIDKRTIAVTLGQLVDMKRLQRVRVNEPSGQFYLGYRVTTTSANLTI